MPDMRTYYEQAMIMLSEEEWGRFAGGDEFPADPDYFKEVIRVADHMSRQLDADIEIVCGDIDVGAYHWSSGYTPESEMEWEEEEEWT